MTRQQKQEMKRKAQEICARALAEELPGMVHIMTSGGFLVEVRPPVNDGIGTAIVVKGVRHGSLEFFSLSVKETM